MNKHWTILLAALPLAAVAADSEQRERGDVVVIAEVPGDPAPLPAADIDVPVRGMDMDRVRRAYGDPLDIQPAVGDPPITRWDYANYSVFFEYDKVIHSVVTE